MTLNEKINLACSAAVKYSRNDEEAYNAIRWAAMNAGFDWRELRQTDSEGVSRKFGIMFKHVGEWYYYSLVGEDADCALFDADWSMREAIAKQREQKKGA